MSLRVELGIPSAAKFVYDVDGNTHIGDVFGGVWCADVYDEDTGEYAPSVTVESGAKEPETAAGLCKWCVQAAGEE